MPITVKNRIWVAAGLAAFVVCCVLNLNAALMGDAGTARDVTVTAGYLLFWVAFLALNRSNTITLRLSLVVSAVTLVAAVLGAVAVFTDFVFWGITFLAIPVLAPLYGLRAVTVSYMLVYPVMLMLAAVWLAVTIILRKKGTRHGKKGSAGN